MITPAGHKKQEAVPKQPLSLKIPSVKDGVLFSTVAQVMYHYY